MLLANDNVELCANYIQKVTLEKIGPEMDKKLSGVSRGFLILIICSETKVV